MEICNALGFEQSRVSHNLKCLENCGFVNSKNNGKSRLYFFDDRHILQILREIDKHIKTYNKRLKYCGVLKK